MVHKELYHRRHAHQAMSLGGFYQQAVSPAPNEKREGMKEKRNNNKKMEAPIEKGIELDSHVSFFRAARQGHLDGVQEGCKHRSRQAMNELDEFGMSALHHAIRENKIEVVTTLLDMGTDVNVRTSQNYTPLILAVVQNHQQIVSVLLNYGADATIQVNDGNTALHIAARRNRVEICKILLKIPRIDVNIADTAGVTPLHFACIEGDVQICELLINKKADILATDIDGKTPFHYVAFYGREIIAELLFASAAQKGLEKEEYIDKKDLEHLTPLHTACWQGHARLVELFLMKGADISARKDDDRRTALHVATECGYLNVVELLIRRGAKTEVTDFEYRTPLHCAAKTNRLAVIKHLLQQGTEIDAQDKWGVTPFLMAVRNKKKEAARLLLSSGANIAATEIYQHNCIHIAVKSQSYEVLVILLEKDDGALKEGSNYEMKRPIHFAAAQENTKILSALLEKECCTVVKDKTEKTPLHVAAENGVVENVETLVQLEPKSLNEKDDTGTTPLHLAATRGYRKTVDSLMRLGANPMSRSSQRKTALHCAVESGEIKSIKALLSSSKELQINAVDNEMNTPLHLAARYGKVKVLQFLLDEGANATALNSSNKTCMDIAIDWGESEVAAAIVQHNRWMEIISLKTENVERPLKALIEKLPHVAKLVLDRCITRSSQASTHPDYTVNIDTSLLDSGPDDPFYAPAVMAEQKREDLLKHPVTQTTVKKNWSSLGKPSYIFNTFLFIIYVVLFTVFIMSERMKVKIYSRSQPNASKELDKLLNNRSAASNVIPIIILLFTITNVLKEIWQVYVYALGVAYFKDLSNLVEWGIFASVFVFIVPFLAEENLYANADVLWSSGVVGLFLSYVNVILYARRVGQAGLYVSMYVEVLKTFCKVILVFAVFLLSWVLVFLVLLKEETTFSNFGLSLMKVLAMFVGELDYSDTLVNPLSQSRNGVPLVPLPELTFILFAVFFITVPILLMNLLVGLAVGDIDAIQSSASMKVMTMQVDYVMNIRERFPKFLLRYFHTSSVILQPNKKNLRNRWMYSDMSFRIDKQFMALLCEDNNSSEKTEEENLREIKTELAKQKERTKALQASLDSQFRLLQNIARRLDPTLDVTSEREATV